MVRWLAGAAVAAVAMYVWGFLFWVVLPLGSAAIRTLPNEDPVRAVLSAELPGTGVYFLPAVRHDAEGNLDPAVEERHREGPLVHLFYRAGGAPVFSVGVMVMGLLHAFVAALIAGYLLSTVLGSLPTYGRRAGFITLLGVFAAFVMRIGDAVWLYHPLGYELMSALYAVVNWLLAGLVLAAIINRPVTGPT